MPPSFLYFDLGRVLVDFDMNRMYAQMGEVAGVEPGRVREALFGDGLQRRLETGQLSNREFYEAFCRRTGSRPDYDALARAGSDIFDLNPSMLPLVAQLQQAGCRMGILSNTCPAHWDHCARRYRIINEAFQTHALSYQLKAAKPDTAIFRAAAQLAGNQPEAIFFVDDMAENVAGARAAGFDAAQYTSAAQLAAELRRRGFRFNY